MPRCQPFGKWQPTASATEGSDLAALRQEYERGFRRAGLPLFIEDYSATSDVFTRAVPALGFFFVIQVLSAVNPEFSAVANVGAVLGGLAILLGGIGLVNHSRGRPFRSIPDRVGKRELAGFVLIPALLPVIFGGRLFLAVETAVENLAILAAIYMIVGYGVLSILRWVGRRLLSQLASSTLLLARAVPLLMVIVLLAFVNLEMWQVFAAIPDESLFLITSLFVALGTAFLLARLPREVRTLEREVGYGSPPLTTRQRRNVGLILFISQALQVLVVSLLVAGFFVVFGAIAVTESVREQWLGGTGDVLWEVVLLGQPAEVTSELLRVSGALAAFSGLYFAISMLTDSTYREEFLEEVTAEMKTTFKARAAYLRLDHEAAPTGADPEPDPAG